MTPPTGTRPAPGTTDLLEVLDRALTGGIMIASNERTNVVELARSSRRARVVVAAADIYLRHPETESGIRPAAAARGNGVQHQPRERHG